MQYVSHTLVVSWCCYVSIFAIGINLWDACSASESGGEAAGSAAEDEENQEGMENEREHRSGDGEGATDDGKRGRRKPRRTATSVSRTLVEQENNLTTCNNERTDYFIQEYVLHGIIALVTCMPHC